MFHLFHNVTEYLFPEQDFAIIGIGRFGEWWKWEKSGSGSYGQVFKVKDNETGENVAIKKIVWPSSETKQNRIIQEVAILKLLSENGGHENIAKFVKAFKYSSNITDVFIAMEYCSGGELLTYIEQHRRNEITMHELSVKKVIKEVLSALVYSHAKGIAHLDIKPENVLFTQPPNIIFTQPPIASFYKYFPSIKLIDWGLSSRFVDFKSCPTTCPKKGTPNYAAPEIYTKNYNEKADIYSVGALMYVMVMCQFVTENPPMTEYKLKHLEMPPEGRYSTEAIVFLKKLMNFDPDKRGSAAEALDDAWLN